jgi:hypothetical protein
MRQSGHKRPTASVESSHWREPRGDGRGPANCSHSSSRAGFPESGQSQIVKTFRIVDWLTSPDFSIDPAYAHRVAQGLNDAAYAASEIMSSMESFSTTGFIRALPVPPRTPARKS